MSKLGAELVAKLVTRTARAGAERVAALDHEAVDDAVKDQPVVERPLHLLAVLWIRPLLGAFGEAHEVGDRVRGVLIEQPNAERPFARCEMRVQHWYALRLAMRSYRYLHLDVFTGHLFGGNQLAVYLDARGLTSSEMQSVAREMNFAETTFVLP